MAERWIARRNGRPCPPRCLPSTEGASDGFALLEVVIAVTILVVILIGIGFEVTDQFSSVASSKVEQTGEALLTKALDSVRAMPYEDVKKGLTNADATFTSTTKYITKSGTTYKFTDTTAKTHGSGEVILHSAWQSGTPPAPLYPHTNTTIINGVKYAVRTFPTQFTTTTSHQTVTGVYRVTVIVSWKHPPHGWETNATDMTILTGQTAVFSSVSTCISGTTNPFAAPCKPNFTASATAGGGEITVAPAAGAPYPVQGMAFTDLELLLPSASSTADLVQTSSVTGSVEASGASLFSTSTSSQSTIKTTAASNDPSSPAGTFNSASLAQTATAVTETATGFRNTLTATPSSTDTGSTMSTAAAKSTQSCANLTGANQTNSLPCGSDSVFLKSQTSLKAVLYAGVTPLGTAPLALVTPTTTYGTRAFSARYAAGTSTCPATRTSGCTYAAARMGLGSVSIGGLPSAVLAAKPTGWGTGAATSPNALITVTKYSAQATSWAKSGTTSHLANTDLTPVPSGSTPTLKYWNGSGYTSLTLNGAAKSTVHIPKVSVTSGTVTVTVTASLFVVPQASVVLSRTSTTCLQACTAKASVGSLVKGAITYLVKTGPTVIADLAITVDLGSTMAATSYQAAS